MKYINTIIRRPVFLFVLVLLTAIIINEIINDEPIKLIDLEAVSNGDKILIHQQPYFNNDEGCIANWNYKEKKEFEAFITFLEKCPKDIESKIYVNNEIARQKVNESNDNAIAKIAIVVPISRQRIDDNVDNNGMRVFDSVEILIGIELAQKEINSKGIQIGEKKVFLEITIVDDSEGNEKNEEKKAKLAANYLVRDKDIVAVVGHFSSDSIQAAADIYEKHKLVAISSTSTAVRRSNNKWKSLYNKWKFLLDQDNLEKDSLKLNSYIFRTSPNDEIAVSLLIKVIENKDNALKKAMILYEEDDVYSLLYKQLFTKRFSESISNNKIINDNSCKFFDATAKSDGITVMKCIRAIEKEKPDFLLFIPSSANALNTASSVLNGIKNLEPKPQLLGSDSMFDPDFLSEKAEGMIVVVPTKTEKFKGIQLNWRSAMTYDAANALAEGIENSRCNASSNSNFNQCLRRKMRKILSRKDFKASGALDNEKKTVYFENGDRVVDESLELELEVPLIVQKNEKGEYSFRTYALDLLQKSVTRTDRAY